jgi:hypothetical protein
MVRRLRALRTSEFETEAKDTNSEDSGRKGNTTGLVLLHND